MPIIEQTPQRLVLQSGSTTLMLDRQSGVAAMQRKILLWKQKPIEAPLADFADVTVNSAVDRASGVEVCHTMLVTRAGAGWAFPADSKDEAQTNAATIRGFLGFTT